MSVSSEELNQRMDQFKDGLRRAGVKVTHQRLEVFREVAQSKEHPDAETIYEGVRKRVPTMSLDTVYRTLWLLCDLGLVATLSASRERARFDANMNSHHHFVCSRCGATYDFRNAEFDALSIPASVLRLGRVERAQVEVRGVCRECMSQADGEPG